ncbi:unnamed protein product [Cuscuta campestris]|uniref:Uncharacterized protein n=1 Tax=Cuscuta campestris TaxID=132261 RepID=A0A484LRI9_9ASTE|nr:unnamed protein product [Cuscuta campestris]
MRHVFSQPLPLLGSGRISCRIKVENFPNLLHLLSFLRHTFAVDFCRRSRSIAVAVSIYTEGNMHLLHVARKAKAMAQNRGREEEAQRGPPFRDTSGSVTVVPNREVVPTRNQRKRKILQAEDEEAASEQDLIMGQSPPAKRQTMPEDGKFSALIGESGGDAKAEADAASLTVVLKDEGEILSSLRETVDGFHQAMQKTVQGFHKEVTAKLSLISDRRGGAEFSSGVNFLASVETELSRLRKLATAKHEQVADLEMQVGFRVKNKSGHFFPGLSIAELESKLHQFEGMITEMDMELAEAVSLQLSVKAERDRAIAEKEQAVAEKEHAIAGILQSPAFKKACMDKLAEYYDSWIETEAGIKKLGNEGPKWLETGVYHGIQLVLRRTRRVDPSFPLPGVDIPDMHDPDLNGELGPNPDYFRTPNREDEDVGVTGEEHPSDTLP